MSGRPQSLFLTTKKHEKARKNYCGCSHPDIWDAFSVFSEVFDALCLAFGFGQGIRCHELHDRGDLYLVTNFTGNPFRVFELLEFIAEELLFISALTIMKSPSSLLSNDQVI